MTSFFQGSFVQISLLCYVCDTFLSCAYKPWGSESQVYLRPQSVAAVCVCVCVKWHTSLAEPHLATQQLSQRISLQPTTLQEPLSKRPLLFCCPRCLFLQMKGQLRHMTNKLPPVRVCQLASAQVGKQSRKVGYSTDHFSTQSCQSVYKWHDSSPVFVQAICQWFPFKFCWKQMCPNTRHEKKC